MYRLYILDFDGTIADTNSIITRTMAAVLSELGLPARSREECSRTIGLPLAKCYEVLAPDHKDRAPECAAAHTRIFTQLYEESKIPVFPGAIEAIRAWHDQGAVVTIASSRGRDTLDRFIVDLGLSEYISYILGSDDVERAKPDPFPVLKTLSDLGFSAKDTLVVGDMAYDIIMGREAGCDTLGVTYGNGSREELEAEGATYVTDNLLDFSRR